MPDGQSRVNTSGGETTDDRELLRAVAASDREAFQELYERHSGMLFALALKILSDRTEAEDVLQDAFVQVWQQAHRFDPERGSAEAFLVSLVRYRALDIVRRTARETPGYEPEEQEDESPDALSLMVATSEGAALQRCLGRLETDRRRLIVMAFVDGLSHGELAEKLSVPLGTVKSWIRRSLLSLRECLAS